MPDRSARFIEFVVELGRRRVFRSAALYTGLAIVVVEMTESLAGPLGFPIRTLPLVAWLAILGFPIAVGLAWTYDVTPRGIVRTSPETDPERRRRRLLTRVAFRLTLTGFAAVVVGAATWVILEPFLPEVQEPVAVAMPPGGTALPAGSVLVLPVTASGDADPAAADRAGVLLVQHLSEVTGMTPLDPRSAPEIGETPEDRNVPPADLGRRAGAERVVAATLETTDGTARLTATLLAVTGDPPPVRAAVEGSSADLEALVGRLVDALSGAATAGAAPGSPADSAENAGR